MFLHNTGVKRHTGVATDTPGTRYAALRLHYTSEILMAPGESSEASGKQQHRPFMHRLRNPGHNGMIEEVMCQRSERANRTRFARCDDASDAKQLHYSVRILRYQQNR